MFKGLTVTEIIGGFISIPIYLFLTNFWPCVALIFGIWVVKKAFKN